MQQMQAKHSGKMQSSVDNSYHRTKYTQTSKKKQEKEIKAN